MRGKASCCDCQDSAGVSALDLLFVPGPFPVSGRVRALQSSGEEWECSWERSLRNVFQKDFSLGTMLQDVGVRSSVQLSKTPKLSLRLLSTDFFKP